MICPPPRWIGSPAITASRILNLTFRIAAEYPEKETNTGRYTNKQNSTKGHWGNKMGITRKENKQTYEQTKYKQEEGHWGNKMGNTRKENKQTYEKTKYKQEEGHWGNKMGNTRKENKQTYEKTKYKQEEGYWGNKMGNTRKEKKKHTNKQNRTKQDEGHWGSKMNGMRKEKKKHTNKQNRTKQEEGYWGSKMNGTRKEKQVNMQTNRTKAKSWMRRGCPGSIHRTDSFFFWNSIGQVGLGSRKGALGRGMLGNYTTLIARRHGTRDERGLEPRLLHQVVARNAVRRL